MPPAMHCQYLYSPILLSYQGDGNTFQRDESGGEFGADTGYGPATATDPGIPPTGGDFDTDSGY